MKRPAASLHGPASSPIKRPAAKPKPKPKAKAKSKVIKAKDPPNGRSMDEVLVANDGGTSSSVLKRKVRQDKIICGSTMKREMEQMANSGEWAAKLASFVNRQLENVEMTVNMWSDCAGMCSEVFGLNKLFEEIEQVTNGNVKMRTNLVGACDSNPDCLQFIDTNHSPRCLVDEMKSRRIDDLNDSNGSQVLVYDLKTQSWQYIPQHIGVYTLGFPCTPWSMRGLGKGWEDPNAAPFFVGIETIQRVQPMVFVLECVEGMTNRSSGNAAEPGNPKNDLDKALEYINQKLANSYMISILRNQTPLSHGYPMMRPRWYAVGILRGEGVSEDFDAKWQDIRTRSSVSAASDYFDFLGLKRPIVPWERLHALPNHDEMMRLERCGCEVNPFQVCQVHKCNCGCKGALTCSWRQAHAEFMKNHSELKNIVLQEESGKITFVELFESAGIKQTSSARERNMLNILSYNCSPLRTSRVVIDKSQSIKRCQFREDGSIPTLATRSSTYSMSLGRDLELPELATLMGLPPSADFTGQTGPAVQKMIGNGMHVACVGQAVGIGVLVRSGLI